MWLADPSRQKSMTTYDANVVLRNERLVNGENNNQLESFWKKQNAVRKVD